MNFSQVRDEKVQKIEDLLMEYLPEEEGNQGRVIEAMRYSVLAGGKRLRPMLMLETYRIFGGVGKEIEPFMAAIEMIHTYSLIHDDLPAMDNDEYRRGRKTTHVVYGEGMAVLAGDGLLNYAFETAIKAFSMTEDVQKVVKAMQILANRAGIYGMIGGQTADIMAEAGHLENTVTKELLTFIQEGKTAALIQASMQCGAVLAGATEEQIELIRRIAYNIGIAFQIQDDILDVTSSFQVLGKPIGSDDKNGKVTYVSLNGLEESKEEVRSLSEEAVAMLHSLPGDKEFLETHLLSLITREK